MSWLKQSTAVTIKLGPFVDEDDGKTAETGLTVTQAEVRLSKNGGNMAQKNEATSLVHDEIGMYNCLLDATDTGTLGSLLVAVHESGALPVFQYFMVVPANVWDSMFGSDKLDVSLVQWLGAAPLALTSQRVNVYVGALAANVITVAGTAAAWFQEAADRVLDRPISNVEPGAVWRTLYGLIGGIVNKRDRDGNDIVVRKTDDTTELVRLAGTADADQAPLSGLDPPA